MESFIKIADVRVRDKVERYFETGKLWPEPRIQLNPAFERGTPIPDLIAEGLLHPECEQIFRHGKKDIESDGVYSPGELIRLHKHQEEAIRAAATGANYVLTTGTGSGKSLAYIIPIVDRVLKQGSGGPIKAIVVYPMNALANSQEGELEKFLAKGYPPGKSPVTFRRYTGQEDEEAKQQIIIDPPDILLTNYVMLELILTRPQEHKLIGAAEGLQFLVFDELHTYRGRQGADVALLARRVREACGSISLQCVGTSATLANKGTFDEQRESVAKVATQIFGTPVEPKNVIGETLRRSTAEPDDQAIATAEALKERIVDAANAPTDYETFARDPMAQWVESAFGLAREPASGRYIRQKPRTIEGPNGGAAELAKLTGLDESGCIDAIRKTLLAGNSILDPETGYPVFAFRLHQFIGRGSSVYSSLEPAAKRHITTEPQKYVPGDRGKILLPLAFCRNCGQDYYVVRYKEPGDSEPRTFTPRDLNDRFEESGKLPAFIYASDANLWPSDQSRQIERLPEDWLEGNGEYARVKQSKKPHIPEAIRIAPDGSEVSSDPSADGIDAALLRSPFQFCINCGISYSARQRSDFAKLGTLSSEGRSTATTVLSLSLVRRLKHEDDLPAEARKLLSFTDDRQDASLQAGHFNDFIQTGAIRAGLLAAVESAGEGGLTHEFLAGRVLDAMGLELADFASDPEVKYAAADNAYRAMRELLGYRLYQDLKRGWRITSPNLEQCGLLKIKYVSLDDLCANDDDWAALHPALAQASPEIRESVASTLLQFMRTELLIKVSYLDPIEQDHIRGLSSQHLCEPWAFDEGEELEKAGALYPRPSKKRDSSLSRFGSARSLIGQYLRKRATFPQLGSPIGADEVPIVLQDLLENLRKAGLVECVDPPKDGEAGGYQLVAAGMCWTPGDGAPVQDPLRSSKAADSTTRSADNETNAFFVDFYRTIASASKGVEAHEHTAQVPYEIREQREKRFRSAELPILYCSPTMELGVDIADLNAVHMRNVPPSPANYAQRSGRAGRQGQPAIVVTYCTAGSPHDQYFFRRQDSMISGEVSLPRIDLHNEDLVRSHMQAIWLRATETDLHKSLKDILDLENEAAGYPLHGHVREQLQSTKAAETARQRALAVLSELDLKPGSPDWYSDRWLDEVIGQCPKQFDRACDRWRELYAAAQSQLDTQNKILGNAATTLRDRETARRLHGEASQQIEILLSSDARVMQSDFYSYRYFASEGFLPGYSFPRLPISAYIPARKLARGVDEYLSRPRFLAISEFGPQAIVYHEGAKYQVNRVIFAGSKGTDEMKQLTSSAKLCEACGYIHPIPDPPGPDRCESCDGELGLARNDLFRMRNAATRRRQRINSDEEDRLRIGYETHSFFRFAGSGNNTHSQVGEVVISGDTWGRLSFGRAATIWKVNAGWRRRKDKDAWGFALDTRNGYWEKNKENTEENDPGDPMGASQQRVVPFVEDKKNCLVIEPADDISEREMRSLQAALSAAIGIVFELEENEIATEALPTSGEPRRLLFYEAAEGGAGVLRLLVDDPDAFATVAAKALDLCHYDPVSGDDLRRADGADEDCEAACYNCLMSYRNQRFHEALDRKLVRDTLMNLSTAKVAASPGPLNRAEHKANLEKLCDSGLEKEWLDFIDENDYELPDAAQKSVEGLYVKPDFYYEQYMATVFIDGPVHDHHHVAEEDTATRKQLSDAGYTVIEFGYDKSTWPGIAAKYPEVFGTS